MLTFIFTGTILPTNYVFEYKYHTFQNTKKAVGEVTGKNLYNICVFCNKKTKIFIRILILLEMSAEDFVYSPFPQGTKRPPPLILRTFVPYRPSPGDILYSLDDEWAIGGRWLGYQQKIK